jgi:hypothetical protein
MREGRVVIGAAITVTPTAPQRVTVTGGSITCATPSGPGRLFASAPGIDGSDVTLEVEVGP